MTDKQIIIDGCDVSGCTRYCADNGKCTAFKSQYLCSERNNCYTKRILKKNKTINILREKLLRKEQECEKYSKALEYFLDETGIECLDEEQAIRTFTSCGISFRKMQQVNNNYKRLLDEIWDTVANNSVINKEDILNMIDKVKRQ